MDVGFGLNGMIRAFLSLVLIVSAVSAAQVAKVMDVVPFGTTSLKVTFLNPMHESDLKTVKIGDFREYLEFDGVLIPFAKKVFTFPKNLSILVAQNTPKKVRIVIIGNRSTTYKLRFIDKNLYISFVDEIPLLQEKTSKPQKSQKVTNENPKKSSISKATLEANRHYRVVIDPGHGGKDCGAMGVNKVCEKTIVLSVAKMLEKELKRRGYTTYMTRNSDTYIDLKKRTEMANAKNAQLFVSIHANSVGKNGNRKTEGVETYFLSTARSERAKDVAEQENKGDIEIMNHFSKFSFLNTLNSHRLIASNKLAIDIQFNILRELRKQYDNVVDGGVREGPFWVLAGALMPSVLIEIGYNSHEIESKRINNKEYQKAIAIGVANGIDGFITKNLR